MIRPTTNIQGHAQKNFAKGIRPGINSSIRKHQVHGFLALFHFQTWKEHLQTLGLVGHGIKFFERIQAVQPLEIPRTDATSPVIKDHRLVRTRNHDHI